MSGRAFIDVPSWEKFQHYKDRNAPWIKTYTELLFKDEYLELTSHQRGVLHGVWLAYASSNRRLTADTRRLSRHLNVKVTTRDLERLEQAGFIHLVASTHKVGSGANPEHSPAPAPSQEAEAETEEPEGSNRSIPKALAWAEPELHLQPGEDHRAQADDNGQPDPGTGTGEDGFLKVDFSNLTPEELDAELRGAAERRQANTHCDIDLERIDPRKEMPR